MDVSQSYLQLEGKLLVARNTETEFHSLLYLFTAPVLVLLALVPLLVALLLVTLEKLIASSHNDSLAKTTGVTKLSNAILLVYGAVVCQGKMPVLSHLVISFFMLTVFENKRRQLNFKQHVDWVQYDL